MHTQVSHKISASMRFDLKMAITLQKLQDVHKILILYGAQQK